jgi:hypothetical protein
VISLNSKSGKLLAYAPRMTATVKNHLAWPEGKVFNTAPFGQMARSQSPDRYSSDR